MKENNKIIFEQTILNFNDFLETQNVFEDRYTNKILIPQYEPTGKYVPIYSLVDTYKTSQLINKINNSKVSEEEKKFLIYSAYRHLVFNYSLIAEYYSNASKEMQELMEESALVIIDFNDAIANGYVKLNENIKEIMRNSGEQASEIYYNQTTSKKGN